MISLSREREATKAIEALKSEVAKLRAKKAVEENERTLLENHLSRARLAVKDVEAKTKDERELRLKALANLAAAVANH